MGPPSTRTRHKTAKPATANRPETQLQAQADTYVMLGTAWCSTPANIPVQQPRANDTQRATETPSRCSLQPVQRCHFVMRSMDWMWYPRSTAFVPSIANVNDSVP